MIYSTRQVAEMCGLDPSHTNDVRLWRFGDRLVHGVDKDEHTGKLGWTAEAASAARLHFALESLGIDPRSRLGYQVVDRAREFRGEQWKDRALIVTPGGIEAIEARFIEQRSMDLVLGQGGIALIVPLEQFAVLPAPEEVAA
jgi:hypothetical protein